ncbi:hypothetical protein SAMN02910292_00522 [Lachnospiraceae bacterium XBB2008]|nr:hypothetical protein SAMN02910292_00522 [Lachnospiraceae bacterium XBB2008]
MKNILKRMIGLIMLTVVLVFSFSAKADAYSERLDYFDFEQTVLKMDAGSVKELRIISYYDYTYYVGPHTSSATYMECSFKSGTEVVRLHIGPDETVKNIFFHFYLDDKRVGSNTDVHDCIEVYVQNIDPEAVLKLDENKAAVEKLRTFSGNTTEFNALCYYYNYKDLRDAFGPNAEALLDHWNTYGKNENRIANRLR